MKRKHVAVPPDEVAIARRLAGDTRIRLRFSEIAIAAQRVDRDGVSAAEVAALVGVTRRTICRHRARRRAAANAHQ